MSAEHNEPAAEPKVAERPNMPEGMFLDIPKPTMPGEVIPPIPVDFQVGLTDKDVKGHRWVVLRGSDRTVTVDFRIPWQLAAQMGAGIAASLAAMQQKAASEENGGLVVPGKPAGGGLFVARPGQSVPRGIPPLNGVQG